MSLRFVTIADIHIGKKDTRSLEKELDKYFFDKINEIDSEKKIDIIFIAGDLFDRILKLNESAGVLAIEFMNNLLKVADDKNILVRLLKGTRTHDFNQLNIFSDKELEYPLIFKIIQSVTVEDLSIKSKPKVLYLPEEYPMDFNNFYDKYLEVENNYYDIIIGHGMSDFVAFTPDEDDSENPVRSAPTFNSSKLMKICKGPIIFGHIHDNKEYKNKFYYTGSFSRYSFKDTNDKGYYLTDMDSEGKFEMRFIQNEMAPTYVTVDMDEYENLTEEKKIDIIKELKEENDYVRFKSSDKSSIDIIKKLSENDSNVKVVYDNKNIEQVKIDEKYRFILDKEFDVDETIKRFIKLKKDKDIDLSDIQNIIKKDKDDLINIGSEDKVE